MTWTPTLYDLLSVYAMAALSFPLLVWSAGYAVAVTIPQKARREYVINDWRSHE